MGEPVRVWLATDSVPFRDRLLSALPSEPEIALLGHCGAGDPSLERRLGGCRPQVLLIDLPVVRRGRGISVLRRYAGLASYVLVIVDSPGDSLAETLLRHRVHGFVRQDGSAHECILAIRRVCEGEIWIPRAMLAAALTWLADERSAPAIAEAARDAARNRYTLRERQIVALVRQGLTNKQIGRELGIVEDTVKKHLQHVYDKSGVRRRSLLALARRFSSSREAGWSS